MYIKEKKCWVHRKGNHGLKRRKYPLRKETHEHKGKETMEIRKGSHENIGRKAMDLQYKKPLV